MKKTHLNLLVLLSFLTVPLLGQREDCTENLLRAHRLYEQGRLYEVISTLERCAADESISRPVRREILSLLQETHLFLDNDKMADSIHLKLLRLDPFFKQNTDIPEVKYLVDQYETYPIATYGVRLGIYTITRPIIEQEFLAFSELDIQDLNYKRRNDDLYGWTVHADLSFNLFKSSVEITTGIGISNIYLRRNYQLGNARLPGGEAQAPASLTFLERLRSTQLPFLLQINAVPRSEIIHSRFIPYFFVGGAPEYLIKHAAQAIGPEIDFPGDADDRSASLIGIGDQRKRFNFSLLAGAGGKFRFKRTYVSFDVRYHRLMQKVTSNSERFTNDALLNTFNYADNDFKLHSVNCSIGVGLFLFRSKRR
ncbi:hypothetical protein [Flavilitoribacter nigricans]|uniref:Outer membrane protein beta-barrel domain-containing protein n=1 Tax=Flavilitoribacter nigricans (strain ATCC 23147 / DSM 23189 / NBRC 102662 / NCIMB 1420 / SS-2) TaxID=1122177 RepID=A0A2D0NGC9_FLAN2|nr:hypothetical protein [Flavilitoribacter nigricans]PHN07527.1 hypothetical protein CRP01_05345 [Flavilitoribacter nigricans DSM 23189 = NBRC 102662]